MSKPAEDPTKARATFAVAYFAIYWTYLWINPEGELLHWVTLVAVPLIATLLIQRRADGRLSNRSALRDLGLHWPDEGRGVRLAILLLVLVQLLQLMNRHQRTALLNAVNDISVIWIVPVSLLLVVLTAGFTEEFFFRGVLQGAVARKTKSQAWGVVVATLAFSLYHVPYAYLNPAWPSAGQFGEAVQLAAVNGIFGGVILGVVFVRSRGSLIPCILVHSAVDWIPAIRLLAAIGEGA